MHDLRALILPAAVLFLSASCSLLAPSDAALMGDGLVADNGGGGDPSSSSRPTPHAEGGTPIDTPAAGGGAAEEPGSSDGGAEVGSPGGAGGDGQSFDFSGLIPQEGLLLWLMADHGIGEETEGAGVAVWADQSIHEADAKQSLPALRPKVVPSLAPWPPMLEFDGVDDQLALPEGFADFSAGLSIFIIANEEEDGECPSLLHLSNEPEQQDIEVGRFHGSIHYEVQEEDTQGPDNTFALDHTVLLSVVHEPTKSAELRINGMFMVSEPFKLPVVKQRVNNFVGRSLYSGCELYHGKIGEIIVYSRALALAERRALETYLQKKWGYEPPIKTKPGPGQISTL